MAGKYLGPAVVDGKIQYLSVSQLKRFDDGMPGVVPAADVWAQNEEASFNRDGCQRKWFLRYVKRLKEPQTFAQEIGTETHLYIERYLKTGEWQSPIITEAGKTLWEAHEVFKRGRHLLPDPGPDIESEVGFEKSGLDVTGIPLTGAIDMRHFRGPNVAILDSKTYTRKAYNKTPDQLLEDFQMLGYAEATRRELESRGHLAQHVDLAHLYFPKEKADGGAYDVPKRDVPLTTIKRLWDAKTQPIGQALQEVARETEYRNVRGNPRACDSFGGCAFKDMCDDLDPLVTLRSKQKKPAGGGGPPEEAKMSFSKFKKPAAPAPSSTLPPKVDDAPAAVKVTPAPVIESKKPLVIEDKIQEALDAQPSIPVLPADAPASDPELASECPRCAGKKEDFQHKAADCPALKAEKEREAAAIARFEAREAERKAKEAAGEAPAEPAKRKRRTKAEMDAARAAETEAVQQVAVERTAIAAGVPSSEVKVTTIAAAPQGISSPVAPAEATTPPAPPEAAKGSTSWPAFELCINCVPSVPSTSLDAYAAAILPLALRLADEAYAKDLVKAGLQTHGDLAMVRYGEGKGFLRKTVLEHPELLPAGGALVIFTTDATQPIADALATKAARVTRGR